MTKQDVLVQVWPVAGSAIISSSKLGTQERLRHGCVSCSGSGKTMVLESGGGGERCPRPGSPGTWGGVSSRLGVGWREHQGGSPEQGQDLRLSVKEMTNEDI